MRERMEQIGGSLEVFSSPGNGTTITAHLPLGHATASP
jgi:signal transduction histidine kinase